MLQPLLANLAVMAMALIAWRAVAETLSRRPPAVRHVLFGLAMGVGAVGSMQMAFQVSPGIFFDLRSPLVAISALFGGAYAGFITAGCALAFRIVLGGSFGFGALAIALSLIIGLVVRRTHPRPATYVRGLAITAAAASLITPAIALFLPSFDAEIGLGDLATHSFVTFAAVLLLGAVLFREGQRRRLAATNSQFRAMVDALPDCLNIKDLEGRFVAANPATARMMRVAAPEQLIGKTDEDFYPDELARQFRMDEAAVLAKGVATVMEQKGLRPDGQESWLATLKAPAFDSAGRLVGLITSNRDITERKLLQDRLFETQAYLDQALKNMSDGLAIYDRGGRLLFCNEQYRQLFPATAHLRVPGADFRTIVAESVAAGEEVLASSVSLEAHIEARQRELSRNSEYLIHRPDGGVYAVRIKVLGNGDTLSVISDATERLTHQRKLEHQALHDPLTGLPNRAYFTREIDRMLAKASRDGAQLVVMLLDLDRFKLVNDSFGHAAGDALLVEVAQRLTAVARAGDFVARLGGDEFAILLSGRTDDVGATSMASRIIKALARPMAYEGTALLPGGTIGYTIWPRDASRADGLLRHADKALYQAKAGGRGSWKAYDFVEGLRSTA